MPDPTASSTPLSARLREAWSRFRVEERATGLALRNWGFRSCWVDTVEGPVHALVRPAPQSRRLGAEPPIVLLHGLVSSGADYFPVLRRLVSTGRALIAPDLPGHGLSPAPRRGMRHQVLQRALHHTLEQLLAAPAVVFGNSMGGLAGLRLALQRPHLVAGLVLASPGGAPLPEPAFSRFLDRFQLTDEPRARAFVQDMRAYPSWIPSVMAWGVRARFGRPEVHELLEGVDADAMLTPAEVAALHHPAVVLWGQRERILPPAHRAFFKAHLPDHVVFEEPAWLGHAAFLDDPGFVARRIAGFDPGVAG